MSQKYNVLEVTNGHHPLTGEFVSGHRVYVFFACGHCSGQELVPSVRDTPKHRCVACARYICERPLCHAQCTPLYSLAKDRFEGGGKWAALVPAIMAGASTPEQAIALGFPKETFNG